MFVSKMGSRHAEYGINNQDDGFSIALDHECPARVSVILDGCSDGEKSEIGAGVFARLFEMRLRQCPGIAFDDIIAVGIDVFDTMMGFLVPRIDAMAIEKYMLFTIMILAEYKATWHVAICGDGCIISMKKNAENVEITPINVTPANAPEYLAYMYLPEHFPEFTRLSYSKKDHETIGISSDGILAIVGTKEEKQFKEKIMKKNDVGIKLFINKLNYENKERGGFFKDDITIAF